ncbi:MAG: glycosyltransferase family 2 protein [Chitinophagaceae bacterium]|nr:glycosyltransferase family 2 protein [Chitinophagaceae bacterium]
MEQPSVAIVILNWNGKKFLQQFLPSVMASSYTNKKIIVADNASTDDSIEFLKQQYPQVGILQNKSNEGFAKGYNTALKQVQADYYVLLNSDVEVTPNWIEPIIDLMESDKGIAACQPKILTYHKKDQFEYAGACGGWLDQFGYPFSRGRVFDICEKDTGQYDNTQQCFWASGAAFFVRTSVYQEVGGLDEYFFAHQEEIDLCWRIQLAGYKIFVQPSSVVYHLGGGTLPRGSSRKTFLNFRNNLIMLTKNIPLGAALWKIPFRVLLDAVSAWRELLSGNGGYFISILKAHLHYAGWLLWNRKYSAFPKKKDGKLSGYYRGSVVWAHFIKKKKTFLEIVGNK